VGKLILVVDDSVTVRQQVGFALNQAGFDIIEACDGQEGVSVIMEHPEIALVLLDIHMPRMDGLEMIDRVKQSAKNSRLPMLILTTEDSPATLKKAKTLGASGWIAKPFNVEKLISAVNWLTG